MKKLFLNIGSTAISIFELICGILLILKPNELVSSLILVIGGAAAAGGLYSIILYFRTAAEDAVMGSALSLGLSGLALGMFLIFGANAVVGVIQNSFSVILGILLLIVGFMKLQWAVNLLRLKVKKWWLECVPAIVTVGAGAVILTYTSDIFLFAGISMVVMAVLDILAMALGAKYNIPEKDKIVIPSNAVEIEKK